MNQIAQRLVFYGLPTAAMGAAWAGDRLTCDSLRKCKSCHSAQHESWLKADHAQAMTALKASEKKRAGLDPERDYTEDPGCIGCHATGYEQGGGYEVNNPERLNEYLRGVGYESCHGPGSEYKWIHRFAAKKFNKSRKFTLRKELAEHGQVLLGEEFEEHCHACHLNYEGPSWPHAEEPYTLFTPEIEPKYEFKFKEVVRNDEAVHKHYKLKGIFVGKPVASFHNRVPRARYAT